MLEDEILEEIENSADSNEIIEITEGEENVTPNEEPVNQVPEPKKKEKKPNKIKEMWNGLDKKKKIIVIVSIVVVLLVIIGLLLYFLVFKKDESEKVKPKDQMVIVEKDNYRYENGKLIFIGENKQDLGSYECQNQKEDLCFVAYYSTEDNFDGDKYVYENGDALETRSDILLDNYVFIYDNKDKKDGDITLYDIKNNKELGKYKLVKEVNDESAIVKDENDKYGVIKFSDEKQENLVEFKYDYLGYILNTEKFVAVSDLNYYLLDMNGKMATKKIPGEIKSFDSKYISVIVDGSYYIYDYNGMKVKDVEYDYLRFDEGFVAAIKNKRIYIFDNDMNALNIDGIKLGNTSYNTTVTFDENKKEVKREQAFDITVNKDNIRLDYDDEFKVINIYEGKLSSKYEYVSYYDGVLYIYSDKEKENLINTYKCSNPNNVEESSTEFNNCFIAHEKVLLNRSDKENKTGYLPIYNKRYVFIQDNPNAKTDDTIILWDLKEDKKQATYKEVDTGFYNNSNNIALVDTANTLVMAKNTNDYYVMIRIENSSLNGVLSSSTGKFEEIKYLKDNLLAKKSDGTYHLYDTKGNELASSSNEIIDYNGNYIQVRDGNGYVVYSMNGKIISTDSKSKYVKLYNKFFIAISESNEIYAYSYSGKNLSALFTDKIIVTDNLDKAFEVENMSENNCRLAILKPDGTYSSSTIFTIEE